MSSEDSERGSQSDDGERSTADVVSDAVYDNRWRLFGVVATLLGFVFVAALLTDVPLTKLVDIEFWLGLPYGDVFTVGFAERALQAAMPIALAAIGGLYAEKSGVFNIGLEGFMIFGAVNAAAVSWILAGGSASQLDLWIALVATVLLGLIYTAVFAVLTIRYKADQIVAGLAVWFLGLGFGPFTAVVMWGGVSSPPLSSLDTVTVPVLAEIPVLGRLLFDANPLLWVTIAIVLASYVVLYRTRYGYWIQAAGENPEALDTAGVSVRRVRYAAVMFSGAVAALAGGMLSIGIGNGFTGTGTTMVDGRGWIAIVAYLFGNYNPILTALASLLFGAAQMLRIQLGTIGVDLPSSLLEQFPYVTVIVVLTLVGATRVPSAVGESYESEE
ncbi:ABC transporter permease [Salinarchaeum laminariae]|uniref:ABC transporter permease n=1 Tax=Salinarchaeum laminariae TaxID=869888 RepID=UPI0020BED32C|nr:ABC transporter permease [Salinarchaeum laminariae]